MSYNFAVDSTIVWKIFKEIVNLEIKKNMVSCKFAGHIEASFQKSEFELFLLERVVIYKSSSSINDGMH